METEVKIHIRVVEKSGRLKQPGKISKQSKDAKQKVGSERLLTD